MGAERSQVVYFHKSNSSGVVSASHYRGVVPRLQRCNYRRLACRSRSMPAVLDGVDLVGGDNAADHCVCQLSLEAITAPVPSCSSNFGLANALGTLYGGEFRTNRAHNDRLWSGSLNDETADHHVVARLHKGARTDVGREAT